MQKAIDYVEITTYWAEFWGAMDARDYFRLLQRLSPACRWHRDRVCVGYDDILESLNQRDTRIVSRHVSNNLVVQPAIDGYDCRYTLTIYSYARKAPEEGPPHTITGPKVADYFAKLTKVEGHWLASEIRADLVFERMPAKQ